MPAFGGAGGQHACLVADALGMRSVFIHPLAGVLSAYGIGLADVLVIRQKAIERPLDEALLADLHAPFTALEAQARAEVAAQGFLAAQVQVTRWLSVKYQGTDSTLALGFDPAAPQRAPLLWRSSGFNTASGMDLPCPAGTWRSRPSPSKPWEAAAAQTKISQSVRATARCNR